MRVTPLRLPGSVALRVVLVVMLVVGFGWALLAGMRACSAEPGAPVVAEVAAPTAAAPTSALAPPGDAEPAPARSIAAHPNGIAAGVDAELLALPADTALATVRVVDATTQQPVAGAAVQWALARGGVFARSEPRRGPPRLRTDAAGLVRVPVQLHRSVAVRATHGERAGHVLVPFRDRAHVATLALAPRDVVSVHVVDARGEPVPAIVVEVATESGDARAAGVTDESGAAELERRREIAVSGMTTFDADGTVTGSATAAGAAGAAGADDADGGREADTWWARAGQPGNITRRSFSGASRSVTLTLPPSGHVDVFVVERGRATADPVVAMRTLDGRPLLGRRAGAAVRFAHVRLGASFVLRVDGASDRDDEVVTGPRTAGEIVQRTVPVATSPRAQVRVLGRLVAPDGTPVASHTGSSDLRHEHGGEKGTLHTGADGAFVATLAAWHAGRKHGVFRVTVPRGPLDVLHAEVPCSPSAGDNHLGDVRLAPWPLLASGRFELAPGSVPRDVVFTIERWCAADGERAAGWYTVEHADVLQHAGAFVARGHSTGLHRVCVDAHAHVTAAPLEFHPGAVELVVPVPCGHFAELFASDAQLPAADFAVVRVGSHDPVRSIPLGSGELDWGTWSCSSGALPPGTYVVEARAREGGGLLGTTAPFTVPTARDGGVPRVDVGRDALHAPPPSLRR